MAKAKKRTTAEDQIGSGAAKKVTKQVEQVRKARESRLDAIMNRLRKQQTTDSSQ